MRLPWRMAIGGNAQNYVYADNVCTGYQDDVSTRFYHCVSGNNNQHGILHGGRVEHPKLGHDLGCRNTPVFACAGLESPSQRPRSKRSDQLEQLV